MALLVKVHQRGTDIKKDLRNHINTTTKRIRYALIASIIINLTLVTGIIIHFIKK